MLRCRDVNELLHDYVDGALDPTVRQQLEEHVADCPGCLAFLDTYRDTISVARDLRCEDMPPELRDKLRTFLREKLERPSLVTRIRRRLLGAP